MQSPVALPGLLGSVPAAGEAAEWASRSRIASHWESHRVDLWRKSDRWRREL